MVAMLMALRRERRSGKIWDLRMRVCVRDKFRTFFSWRYLTSYLNGLIRPAGFSCLINFRSVIVHSFYFMQIKLGL